MNNIVATYKKDITYDNLLQFEDSIKSNPCNTSFYNKGSFNTSEMLMFGMLLHDQDNIPNIKQYILKCIEDNLFSNIHHNYDEHNNMIIFFSQYNDNIKLNFDDDSGEKQEVTINTDEIITKLEKYHLIHSIENNKHYNNYYLSSLSSMDKNKTFYEHLKNNLDDHSNTNIALLNTNINNYIYNQTDSEHSRNIKKYEICDSFLKAYNNLPTTYDSDTTSTNLKNDFEVLGNTLHCDIESIYEYGLPPFAE